MVLIHSHILNVSTGFWATEHFPAQSSLHVSSASSISRSKISNGKSICPLLGTPLLQHQMHETCTLTQRTVGYWNGLGECSRKNLYLSQNPLIHSIPLRQQIVSLRRLAKRAMPWQWKHAVYTQAALTRSQNTMEIYIYSVPISMVPSVEFDPANFNYFSI